MSITQRFVVMVLSAAINMALQALALLLIFRIVFGRELGMDAVWLAIAINLFLMETREIQLERRNP